MEAYAGGHFALTERAGDIAPLLVRHLHEGPALGPAGPPTGLVRDIYLAGADGSSSRPSTDLTALQDAARAVMTPTAYGYVAGDAATGITRRADREVFDRWRNVPRMPSGMPREPASARPARPVG
ncbi:hypothetical protein [Streptomyces sp. NPDC001508]|uniref:hypothetical protein n=1 Tax=Streptomyces sp. NPDC001508 TaxID=3154656 RepID=UPI00332AB82C